MKKLVRKAKSGLALTVALNTCSQLGWRKSLNRSNDAVNGGMLSSYVSRVSISLTPIGLSFYRSPKLSLPFVWCVRLQTTRPLEAEV